MATKRVWVLEYKKDPKAPKFYQGYDWKAPCATDEHPPVIWTDDVKTAKTFTTRQKAFEFAIWHLTDEDYANVSLTRVVL